MKYLGEEKFCEWCGKSSLYAPIDRHHYYRVRINKDAIILLCRDCHNETERSRKFFEIIQQYAKRKYETDSSDNE